MAGQNRAKIDSYQCMMADNKGNAWFLSAQFSANTSLRIGLSLLRAGLTVQLKSWWSVN
jgi:hypothetical protein